MATISQCTKIPSNNLDNSKFLNALTTEPSQQSTTITKNVSSPSSSTRTSTLKRQSSTKHHVARASVRQNQDKKIPLIVVSEGDVNMEDIIAATNQKHASELDQGSHSNKTNAVPVQDPNNSSTANREGVAADDTDSSQVFSSSSDADSDIESAIREGNFNNRALMLPSQAVQDGNHNIIETAALNNYNGECLFDNSVIYSSYLNEDLMQAIVQELRQLGLGSKGLFAEVEKATFL